jgi:uncharacterized protein YbjT (DUF2867 family)
MSDRVVAVTGASGFVGRSVVRELLSRGWSVRALIRSREKAQSVLPSNTEKLTLVEGTILQPQRLDELLNGATAVIHLVGILREAGVGQTFERIHVDGTRKVIEAAQRAGVERYVHMSAMGADPCASTGYWKSKGRAERLVTQSGLAWTIFRPGLIHGVDGEMVAQIAGWVKGRSLPFVMVPYFARIAGLSATGEGIPSFPPTLEAPVAEPVFVDDVARAFAEALERDESVQEIYPLTGPERVSWPELLAFAQQQIPNAKKLPIVPIPGVLAMFKAKAAALIGLRDLLPFDDGMAVMGQTDTVGSNAKAQRQLGLEFAPFKETMASYADAL